MNILILLPSKRKGLTLSSEKLRKSFIADRGYFGVSTTPSIITTNNIWSDLPAQPIIYLLKCQKCKEQIKELQTEHGKIKNRMDRLTDLFPDGEFNEEEYREKCRLINLVLGNFELKGQKLEFTLRSPFDAFVKTAKNCSIICRTAAPDIP